MPEEHRFSGAARELVHISIGCPGMMLEANQLGVEDSFEELIERTLSGQTNFQDGLR